MPKSLYKGGKQRRHFTLSLGTFDHLSLIAKEAQLSRSETLERLIRSTPVIEGSMLFSNTTWPMAIDHSEL
jgi:hypothetical protein